MVRCTRSLVVAALAAALALPATVAAQTAIPRTGGSSSGSSSGSSGGSSTSGGSSSGESRIAPPNLPSFPTDNRRPSSSSSRSGATSSRGGSATGDGYAGPGTTRGGEALPRGGYTGGAGAGTGLSGLGGSRSRGDRPTTGTAVERPFGYNTPNYNLYFPVDPFSPWGRWYPWYYGGFGYGYVSFDPWRYGTSRYSMYRYGAWYNPYDPWCYGVGYWLCDPWGGATTASYGGSSRDEGEEEPTASVRLRVSPAHAEVFVDGALVGIVDDFNGLSGHLKLTITDHLVEIKADGYETFVPKLDIEAGRTVTVRGSLKKIK